jgi:hypothetical protein
VITAVAADEEVAWLLPGLSAPSRARVHHVDELLPQGYGRYLRLFHPFVPWASEPAEAVPKGSRRSWQSLAQEAGVTFHSELSWRSLEPVVPLVTDGGRRYSVYEGQLESFTANRLLTALVATGPAQPVFFVYSHPGCLIATPNHEPLAFRGLAEELDVVREAAGQAPGPTYIWPEDRRWLVTTDADLVSTYVACDIEAAESLMADGELEVLAVTRNTRIDDGSDQLNGTGYPEDYPGRAETSEGEPSHLSRG